jgi:Domain of unknown function (DUF4114)/VPDSG-CTERM motif
MKTENRSMKTITGLAASLALFGFIGAVQAGPITLANLITAQGGNVTVTFLSKEAADTDLIFLAPDTSTTIFNNQTANAGDTVPLGTFAAGTVLTFTLDNINTGYIFSTGDGTHNPDGDVHAQVLYNYNGHSDETYVGFEDLYGNSSDWDYNDLKFYVTTLPSTGGNTGRVPDVSSTLSLFGISLTGLAAFARRFKK